MPIENPFIRCRDVAQHFSWRHLKPDVDYHLNFLLPVRALVQQVSRDGAYVIIAAEVLEDRPTLNFLFLKGERIVVDFPTRTFERAWVSVAVRQRETGATDNIRLVFVKRNLKNMHITSVERSKASPVQVAFAESIYNHPEIYACERGGEKE